nr:hypothetical protein CFP56_26707 [Quercus suber]
MNILMWNCRGALNSDFKRRVFELVGNHCPSIMVITKTRVGGVRAEKKIIEGLPFDGSITNDTIGYAGGLWILWNKEDAKISLLANMEQEIHATLKEEEYWALKSRIYAAAFGDRNTFYFHMSTIVRKQRNKIRCLKNSVGE